MAEENYSQAVAKRRRGRKPSSRRNGFSNVTFNSNHSVDIACYRLFRLLKTHLILFLEMLQAVNEFFFSLSMGTNYECIH